jgi:hypothetical protein
MQDRRSVDHIGILQLDLLCLRRWSLLLEIEVPNAPL